MTPARHLLALCLPLLLAACAPLPHAARTAPEDDDAPILRIANMLSMRGPVSATRAALPPAQLQPQPAQSAAPARAVAVATAPARPAAAPAANTPPVVVPVQELPLQALPNREVTALLALSDSEALGPIVDKVIPLSSSRADHHTFIMTRPAPPPPRPVHCKAVRSRNAGEEKIAISCGNTGKVPQAVFLQIDATGMDGVPPPAEAKSGFMLPPGKTRQLALLTTVSRPARADIYFTHEARP